MRHIFIRRLGRWRRFLQALTSAEQSQSRTLGGSRGWVIGPFLVVMASFLCLNLLVATFFYVTTDMDLLTCLFCAAPGGIGDTPLVAMDMGADGARVSVMQFVRMIFGMGCLPTIIMLTDRRIAPEQAQIFDGQGAASVWAV